MMSEIFLIFKSNMSCDIKTPESILNDCIADAISNGELTHDNWDIPCVRIKFVTKVSKCLCQNHIKIARPKMVRMYHDTMRKLFDSEGNHESIANNEPPDTEQTIYEPDLNKQLMIEHQRRNQSLKTSISQIESEIQKLDPIIKRKKRELEELTKIKDNLCSEMIHKKSLLKVGQSIIDALTEYEKITSTNNK